MTFCLAASFSSEEDQELLEVAAVRVVYPADDRRTLLLARSEDTKEHLTSSWAEVGNEHLERASAHPGAQVTKAMSLEHVTIPPTIAHPPG